MVIAMTENNSRFNFLPPPLRLDIVAEKLNRLQAEFVSEALRRAVDDVGAAMAHQLHEPLNALLLHLHAIKRPGEHPDGTQMVSAPVSEIVDMALREAERIREILGRAGRGGEAPVDAETAVARGREAIEAWTRNSHVSAVRLKSPVAGQHSLTPREQQVLELITGGASNKQGGRQLGISTRTFEAHRAHLMGKLGTRNVADLVRVGLAKFNGSQSRLTSVED
jgi:DNA-binding CsgD family transcriptional regulator